MFKLKNMKTKIILILALSLVLSACNNSNSNNKNNMNSDMNNKEESNRTVQNQEDLIKTYKYVKLKTNFGDIKIKLFEETPITSNNFLNLAQDDFYDGTKFHRVIEGFMIQGGDPLSKDDSLENRWGTGSPGYVIPNEDVSSLSNVRGTISMANSGPGTGGSQFFINTTDNVNLDFDKGDPRSQHTVFGEVVEGMQVVDDIEKVETKYPDRPTEPVIVTEIELLKD